MKDELIDYGLSEKEAEIYLACLKTGETTANRLTQLTKIRRSTVYEVLDNLKKKAIVTSLIKNKKYYFRAVSPSALIDLLRDKERLITSIMPKLKEISGTVTNKTKVELFEGNLSVKEAVLDMLNNNEILVYGGSTIGDEIFGTFTENFARRRVSRNIKMKSIIGKSIPRHMLDKSIRSLTEIRSLSLFEGHKSVYFIYGESLLIVNLGAELTAIRVSNNALLVNSQRKIFDNLWKGAKKV